MAEKYYGFSTYCYCAGEPVGLVDEDGQKPRIYVETKSFGHAFVTVGTGDQTVVYSYGRYGALDKEKSSSRSTTPSAEGVLLRLEGQNAKDYINKEINEKNAQVFEFSEGSDELVAKHFDSMFNQSSRHPSAGKYKDSDDAKVIDKYSLLNNNCVTTSITGIQQGVENQSNLDGIFVPHILKGKLNKDAQKNEKILKIDKKDISNELGL